MENNLGMGVMLGMLGGNAETVNAIKSSLNKTIKKVYLADDKLQCSINICIKLSSGISP